MPWSVTKITAGALRNAGRYTEPTSQRQYIFYQSACLAKHANPLLQRQAPVADSEFARTLNADPVVTASATNRAFIGAYMAGVSALIAAEVYLRGAGLASSDLQNQARDLIPRWNILARSFETVRDANRKSGPQAPR